MPRGANEVGERVERFERNGATLVDEVLDGPPDRHIIFLHGWGANRDSLRGIAALFQPTDRVHLIDLPGFGDAPPPPAEWGPSVTSDYADLIQQYILDRVHGGVTLVGHSFGGRVALRLAARRLAPIRAVVLMAVPGLPAPFGSRVRLRRAAIRALRTLLRAVGGVTGPGPLAWHTRTFGSRDYLAAGELKRVFVGTVNEDLTESARAVASPVLLLWGSDDTETPPWLAYQFQALMDGHATVEMLPHKDHYLYTGTGAHLCAFKIRSWLDARGARDAR